MPISLITNIKISIALGLSTMRRDSSPLNGDDTDMSAAESSACNR